MNQFELEQKKELAKSYFGRKLILKPINAISSEKTFTLVGYKERSYGDIRSYGMPITKIENYSSSLFGIIMNENQEIDEISMDEILKSIDQDKPIDYSF